MISLASRRILHVFGRMVQAGAELRTLDLMRTVDRRQYRLDYCVLSGREGYLDREIAALGGAVYACPLGPLFPYRFLRLLRSRRFDVVHSHVHHFSGFILRLAAQCGVPVRVAHFRSSRDGHPDTLRRRLQRRLMRHWIDRHATNILSVSEAAMEAAWLPNWRDDPRCEVIYNGLCLSAFQATCNRDDVRHEFGFPPSCLLAIHVGRLAVEKNHPRLLSVFRELLRRRPEARLLVVGWDDHGGDRRVREEIQRLRLENEVVMAGARSDVPRLLKAADVLIFPSLWEGLREPCWRPVRAGTPVVGSDLAATGRSPAMSRPFAACRWASPTRAGPRPPRWPPTPRARRSSATRCSGPSPTAASPSNSAPNGFARFGTARPRTPGRRNGPALERSREAGRRGPLPEEPERGGVFQDRANLSRQPDARGLPRPPRRPWPGWLRARRRRRARPGLLGPGLPGARPPVLFPAVVHLLGPAYDPLSRLGALSARGPAGSAKLAAIAVVRQLLARDRLRAPGLVRPTLRGAEREQAGVVSGCPAYGHASRGGPDRTASGLDALREVLCGRLRRGHLDRCLVATRGGSGLDESGQPAFRPVLPALARMLHHQPQRGRIPVGPGGRASLPRVFAVRPGSSARRPAQRRQAGTGLDHGPGDGLPVDGLPRRHRGRFRGADGLGAVGNQEPGSGPRQGPAGDRPTHGHASVFPGGGQRTPRPGKA